MNRFLFFTAVAFLLFWTCGPAIALTFYATALVISWYYFYKGVLHGIALANMLHKRAGSTGTAPPIKRKGRRP